MSPALRNLIEDAVLVYGDARYEVGVAIERGIDPKLHVERRIHKLRAVMALIDSIAAPVAPVVLPTRSQLYEVLYDLIPEGAVYTIVDKPVDELIAAGFAREDDPEPVAVEPYFDAMTDSEVEAWMKDQVGEEGWTATRFVGTRADIPPTHGKRWAAYLTKPTDGPMTEVFEKTYAESIRALAKSLSAATDSGEGTGD